MRTPRREHLRRCLTVGCLVISAAACSDTSAPAIEIVLSQPSVDFRAVRGTTQSLTKTITVANGGDGRLGPVSCPANPTAWLSCDVANGNAVTFTAKPTGLAASPTAASVQISAVGQTANPQTVQVNLIIDQPVLTLSTSTVSFTASEGPSGGTLPATATVTVSNTGAGTLANLGTITCAASPVNTRVGCAVNQGTGALTLSVDPSNLAPGTHVFPVVVAAPNDNVSKTIAVTLAVSAIPRIALSQQTLVFQTIRGSGAPPGQTVIVGNSGGGSLGTVSCPANPASWLSCTVSNGTTLTFSVNPTGLTVSPAAVSVPVSATSAANSPQLVTVNFTLRQPVLSVSATSVAFTVVSGSSVTTPALHTVDFSNTGEGTLANLGDITCTPPVGSPVTCAVDAVNGTLTLTVNPAGQTGTKLFPVVVSSPNSSISRTVTVTLTAAPGISLSPNELNFQAVRGSTTDIVKKVKVSNSGGGTLGVISCPANPTPWLTCGLGTADTVVLTAKPTGLTASPADVLVPISVVGAFNTPQDVAVSFTILQPVLSLPVSLFNVSANAGATTAAQVVSVTNTGAGNLQSLGTISCNPSHVRVSCTVNQAAGTLSVTINTATATALTPGTYVFTASVGSSNTSPLLQTVTFVLTVN